MSARTYTGTQPSPEVSRALRGVMRNATPMDRRATDTVPNRIAMWIWTCALGALLVVAGVVLIADLSSGPREVKTYQLDRS